MTRPHNQYCPICKNRMSRMYTRITGCNPKAIGFVCKCGKVIFDKEVDNA
jgi:hypothetical protein